MRLVAVLGYSGRRKEELHAVCEARVRHAESLDADAVLLSGEAELMHGAWRGRQVELDPRARNTWPTPHAGSARTRSWSSPPAGTPSAPGRSCARRCTTRASR
jgi:hypothetical protein